MLTRTAGWCAYLRPRSCHNVPTLFRSMWCNTNWGDLLQPAPLSIALLGSLMVIASSTNDFCSLLPLPSTNDIPLTIISYAALISENKSAKFTYAKYPTSFKTCLQQMVGDGYSAFETASHQMTRINNASSQLPEAIKRAVTVIIQSTSPIEVEYLLPNALDSVSELTNICMCVSPPMALVCLKVRMSQLLILRGRDASRTCERAFVRISALAQEILECTTYKVNLYMRMSQLGCTSLRPTDRKRGTSDSA